MSSAASSPNLIPVPSSTSIMARRAARRSRSVPLSSLSRPFLFGGGQNTGSFRQPMHADGPGRIVIDHARLDGPGEKARTAAFIRWSEARRGLLTSITARRRTPGPRSPAVTARQTMPGVSPGHAGHRGEVPAVCGYGRRGASFGRQAGTERLLSRPSGRGQPFGCSSLVSFTRLWPMGVLLGRGSSSMRPDSLAQTIIMRNTRTVLATVRSARPCRRGV